MSDVVADRLHLLELTSEIASAHVAHNVVALSDLPQLIEATYATLAGLGASKQPPQEPAVPVKKSVKKDSIVCLDCGRSFKTLKRHLGAEHGMTLDEYRAKWKLPGDYPTVAADYVARRQAIAHEIGLGRKPGKPKRSRKQRT